MRRQFSFSLGPYTTVFQVELYAIKACTVQLTDKGYRNIHILSDSQDTIRALNNYQTNSELA
jgi:ribonuclease HI